MKHTLPLLLATAVLSQAQSLPDGPGKEVVTGVARLSRSLHGDDDLWNYFQTYGKAFR